jgi:hypothetical protein
MRWTRDVARPNQYLIRTLLAALLAVVCAPARAHDPSPQLSQYVLNNWQTSEGLSRNSANAIARTPGGRGRGAAFIAELPFKRVTESP